MYEDSRRVTFSKGQVIVLQHSRSLWNEAGREMIKRYQPLINLVGEDLQHKRTSECLLDYDSFAKKIVDRKSSAS